MRTIKVFRPTHGSGWLSPHQRPPSLTTSRPSTTGSVRPCPRGVGQGHEARDVDVVEVITRSPSTKLSDKQIATARSQ